MRPYQNQLVAEERVRPHIYESTYEQQPFLATGQEDIHTLSQEQIAYALGQVTASKILPTLTLLENGYELLEYRVELRAALHGDLVNELVDVLDAAGEELHWNQVDANSYLCVIGAGVAACIDTTPEQEQLYLRYANTLVDALHNAHRAAELPRSLLFLETALHERFDALLTEVRSHTWHWLSNVDSRK